MTVPPNDGCFYLYTINMKKTLFYFLTFIAGTISTIAQVGIGVNNPEVALEVNGTVRVENLPLDLREEVTISGISSGNNLSRTRLGAGIIVNYNTLETSTVTRTIGSFDLGVPIAANGTTIHNLNLNFAIGEANANATFITIYNYATTIDITGISGGVHGRRITLSFSQNSNVRFKENDTGSLAQNRFLTLATSQITVSGVGFVELVYDETAGSDRLGRWLVIKFRP